MADRSEFDFYETSFASPDEISSDYSPENLSAKDQSALNLQTESSVLLPSAEFLTDAALVRQNEDLVLTLPDGREMVVEGYFAADPRPTLTLADGVAVLTPELVQSFLQESIFAGEGSATATDSITNSTTNSQGSAIGNAETVIGEAIVLRAGQKIPLEAGDPVFEGDIIETETGGSAKLRFIDETVFSISEEARMALDKMVFNPETEQGETVLSMLKGGFLFVSGLIAKTDPSDMQVVTPVATIGIRGTIVTGTINPGEAFEFSVIDGAIAVQPQGADEPIVMDNAFATLGGSISENGEITTRISQDSAREVIERNAGQFATLSDADVAVIETAVTATAVQNGETVTLDLPDLIEEVVAEITAADAAEDQDAVLESPVEPVDTTPVTETDETGDIDLEPVEEPVVVTVVEPEPEPEPEPDDPEPEPDPVVAVDPLVIFALTGVIGRANAILSGTAQAGATIEVVGTLNGVEEPALTTTATGGNWSVDLGADSSFNPDNVIYTYSVTATDAAGTTLDSATTDVQLDFVAPEVALDSTLTDGTTLADSASTTLSGTSSGEATSVTVVLTADNGQTVTYDNIVPAADGAWSVDLTTNSNLDQSGATTYNIAATAKDAAGNISTADTVNNISVDLTAGLPNATLASEGTANTMLVSGDSAESGATVTVDLMDATGAAVGSSQTATVDANGDWSVSFSDVLSGNYEALITATDSATNSSEFTIDSTYVAIYNEDWTNLGAQTVDYSTTHTGGGVEIITSSEADTITTTDSADIITSGSGNDIINTLDGNDEINLTYSDYTVFDYATYSIDTGAGDDTINASDQAFNVIYYNTADEVGFDGGAGDDTFVIYNENAAQEVAAGNSTSLSGFETIMVIGDIEYDSTMDQKKLTLTDSDADNATESYRSPTFALDSDGDLSLSGQILNIETVTIENAMEVIWWESNSYPDTVNDDDGSTVNEITLSAGIDSDTRTQLTLRENVSRTDASEYDFHVKNSFVLEANTTLTLQADGSVTADAAGGSSMSNLLKVGEDRGKDEFIMHEDAKLVIDFLDLLNGDLVNAENVIDFTSVDTDDSEADQYQYLDLAGTLVFQADTAINQNASSGDEQTIIAIDNDGAEYTTFDEILFLTEDGGNLVTTGTVNALVPIFDMDTTQSGDYGLKLKAVTAEGYVNGSTMLSDSAAYYTTASTTTTEISADDTNTGTFTDMSFYGSSSGSDTFTISSADQLTYFDGGSGDYNDTLKIVAPASGDSAEAIQFYDSFPEGAFGSGGASFFDTALMDFQVNRIETLDISENGAYDNDALMLSVAVIKALTEDTNSTLAGESLTSDISHSLILKVGKDNEDRFDTAGWTKDDAATNATNYTVYTQDDARVYIDAS